MARSAQSKNYQIKRLATSGFVLGIWAAIAPITLASSLVNRVVQSSTADRILLAQAYEPPPPNRNNNGSLPGGTRVYNPPPPNGDSSSNPSGGSRGLCGSRSGVSLLAIAPQVHIGQTSSTRPTLAWYVPEATPYDMVFQLFQGDATEPLYDVQITSQQGLMTWSLPANAAALTVGETYRWRVILICDRNRPSLSVRDGAALTVVASPRTSLIATATDSVAYARQMATAGFWYDALAATLSTPATPALRSLRVELLQELAELEAATDPRRANNLRSLAELER